MFRGIAEGITHGAVNYTRLPRLVPRARPGLYRRRGAGAVSAAAGGSARILDAAAPLRHRAHALRHRLRRGGRALRGHPGAAAAWPWCTCFRAWSRARPPSSTSRTWGRPNPTPAPATNWPPSRRSCWAARRYSADGARSGARCSACFRFRCCRTACGWPRCPSELTGVLTGAVLVLAIALGRLRAPPPASARSRGGALPMKNSQLAVLCAAILAGSLIVAGTNAWLVHSLVPAGGGPAAAAAQTAHRPVIAMMPKAKGDPYFVSCRVGAEEAARDARRRPDLGRPHRPRPGKTERSGGGLDHARRGRDRGERGEPGGHLDRAAQSPRARHQGADVGCRCGARRARFLHQPGHRRRASASRSPTRPRACSAAKASSPSSPAR